MSSAIDHARALLSDAPRVVVLTGAGISAESGVPTFRGPDGLWKSFRPEELATPHAFARDPRLVWEWYGWRRATIAACSPNRAHLALARFALERPGVRIVTQNVDGLHAEAAHQAANDIATHPGESTAPGVSRSGPDAARALPLELHGSIFRTRCTSCGSRAANRDPIDATDLGTLPHCARCSALLRPEVVWFGESLDPTIIGEAFELAAQADVCLVVGTSAVVQPAASIASVTRAEGGRIIEVNPDPTPLTAEAAVSIRGRAVEVIGKIVGGDLPT